MSEAELLVFARCAGFAFRAPGFSHPSVPPPLRAGLAFAFAAALGRPYAATARSDGAGFVFALATETLVGAAIGVAASMLYDGAFSGGRTLDDYVGIRSSVPSANVQAGAGFGRLWSLAFTTGYFALGGYAVAIVGFADTFATLPPGTLATAHDLRTFAVTLPQTLLRAAIFVAGPAIAIALVAQLGLAIVARLVPRFATFTLAFPIVFACVLVATVAALPLAIRETAVPWMDLAPLHAAR
ncbi:MAG: hypothetical protein NVS1B2_10310 [Vulcanimicrobiaceae bacterium]